MKAKMEESEVKKSKEVLRSFEKATSDEVMSILNRRLQNQIVMLDTVVAKAMNASIFTCWWYCWKINRIANNILETKEILNRAKLIMEE